MGRSKQKVESEGPPVVRWDTVDTRAGAVVFAIGAADELKVLRFLQERDPEELAAQAVPGADLRRRRLVPLGRKIVAFVAGRRQSIDVAVAPEGTPFQQRVWAALRKIPYGETRSYGQLAAELDMPKASRAVGRANALNPVALAIPCHRVVGSNGALTGFNGGTEVKERLLRTEGSLAPGAQRVTAVGRAASS